MVRLPGILKVISILILDFVAIYTLFGNAAIAFAVTGVIALYVWLGGYLALFKEDAVSSKKLPSYEEGRLESVRVRLIEDVKNVSAANISNLKVYLIPGNDDMNATAYGANCVSVTRGTFNNADPITLAAVLGHEISHILNYDAEFNRAVFISATLIVGAISVLYAVAMVFIFLIFLILNCFRSWLGILVFKRTKKVTGGIFGLLQRGVDVFYRGILGLVSRHAEYRCDSYSCNLGYGIQLSHFLSIAAPYSQRPLTLTEALYRSHPPAEKRIARLEGQMSKMNSIVRRGI